MDQPEMASQKRETFAENTTFFKRLVNFCFFFQPWVLVLIISSGFIHGEGRNHCTSRGFFYRAILKARVTRNIIDSFHQK